MTRKVKKKNIILIVCAVMVALGFICERNARRLENAKYGLSTSVKKATPTSVFLDVKCSGGKNTDSLEIDNEIGFYLDKWTLMGWESVEYLDDAANIGAIWENYDIDKPVTHEIGAGWQLTYGELENGTYKIKLPILGDGNTTVGYCHAVFKVLN